MCLGRQTPSARSVESKILVPTDRATNQLRTYNTNIHFVQGLKGGAAAAMVGHKELSARQRSGLFACLAARALTEKVVFFSSKQTGVSRDICEPHTFTICGLSKHASCKAPSHSQHKWKSKHLAKKSWQVHQCRKYVCQVLAIPDSAAKSICQSSPKCTIDHSTPKFYQSKKILLPTCANFLGKTKVLSFSS